MKVPYVLLATLVIGAGVAAQSGRGAAPNGDWPMYSHSLSGQRFAAMTDINTSNVGRLAQGG